MIWFSIVNYLREKKSLPDSIVLSLIFRLMCVDSNRTLHSEKAGNSFLNKKISFKKKIKKRLKKDSETDKLISMMRKDSDFIGTTTKRNTKKNCLANTIELLI